MNLEKQAIDILRTFAGNEPYQLGYSGGKDSDVILHLAKKAGVPFVAVHNLTTVDAPETVRYVKSKSEVLIEYPKMTMWQLIVKHKTPPTRRFRYCCEELKERSGVGKKLITGVRKAESIKRAQNQGIVTFTKPNKEIKKRADDENFQSTAAGHFGEVRAFLIKYYGEGTGQDIKEPLDTITSRDRFGLVTINGVDYQIVDIGLRMLEPRELYGCQGFPEDYIIDHDYTGKTYPRSEQVRRCGNAVCPPIPAALVRANLPEMCVTERMPNMQIEAEQTGQLRFA